MVQCGILFLKKTFSHLYIRFVSLILIHQVNPLEKESSLQMPRVSRMKLSTFAIHLVLYGSLLIVVQYVVVQYIVV